MADFTLAEQILEAREPACEGIPRSASTRAYYSLEGDRLRASRGVRLSRARRRIDGVRAASRDDARRGRCKIPGEVNFVLDPQTQAVLDEVVRRIIEVAAPERIVLFGSAARGEWRADSDLDLLIIKRGVEHRRRLAQEIDRHLFGISVPVDVIVVTPEDVQAAQGRVGSVIGPALAEGRDVYAV